MDWRIQFANGEISDAGNVADFVLAPYRDRLCGASGPRLYGIDTDDQNLPPWLMFKPGDTG